MAKKEDTTHFLNAELDKRAKKGKVAKDLKQKTFDPVKVARVTVKNEVIKGKQPNRPQ